MTVEMMEAIQKGGDGSPISGYDTRITFAPSDAHAIDIVSTGLTVTEARGLTVAHVGAFYTRDGDDPLKRLRSGQVGRLEIVHAGDENPARYLTLERCVLTCVTHAVEIREAVHVTFAFTEVG